MFNSRRIRKFAEKNTGEILAYKHLAIDLMITYGIRLGHGVSATNYSHQVWLKRGRHVPKDKVKAFHKDVERHINDVKASEEYQELLWGNATPTQIIDTAIRYAYVKKCGG